MPDSKFVHKQQTGTHPDATGPERKKKRLTLPQADGLYCYAGADQASGEGEKSKSKSHAAAHDDFCETQNCGLLNSFWLG